MFTLEKTFNGLKFSLLFLGIGILILTVELFHLSQYGERFSALKSQHELIDKILHINIDDPQMAAILMESATSEIALFAKNTGNEAILDLVLVSDDEQASLLESLNRSSEAFRNSATIWSESLQVSRNTAYQKMIKDQAQYQNDINALMVYHASLLTKSIELAKYTAYVLLPLSLILFIFFGYRLNRIALDIKQAGSVDTDGTPKEIKTKEIDFMIKRLSRKAPTASSNANAVLLNPKSGILNEQGMQNAFSTKRSSQAANTLFIALFEVDQHPMIAKELTKDEQSKVYHKLAEILSFYELPNDVIAQLDNDRFVFLLSRNTKDIALDAIQKIVDSVKDSTFNSSKGGIKLTLSAGFLLKPPMKSLDETIIEAGKLIQVAQESGGNRVAQLRDRSDAYN